ncbi:pyridoxamine 5'-phosphate oxidase family protein [Bradyrhizobium sp. SRS-191]|uniref:pyridoxamine 5'-phosphate oxidase family protein n=1 Tax=Bradyrhizobium sp. SRS-191 TaxID=2962606 RepID=UPI00211DC21C|nr:pyridoxamine 5'-phosphate oxidase family protein [Bradyrhizobium sp. SRS-191]
MSNPANADLAAIYPKPQERVIAKVRPALDAHSRRFISLSPFCVMATSGTDGSVDASPRGGHPGFVHIDGDHRLLLPDRPGNNRLDSLRNVSEGSGQVQLIFFVPGLNETLRVGGTASVSADPDLLAKLEEFGKPPRSVVSIDVQEVYFHCGKAIMRSKLWAQDAQVPRSAMPSISEIIHDQTSLGAPEPQEITDARWREQL